MRFVLDEDVDAALQGVLTNLGHEAWTVPAAGLQSDTDEAVAVYAHTHGNAVVVTHDREFSSWRRRRCVGRHLYLKCNEWDAAPLVSGHIDSVVDIMQRHDDLFCRLSRDGVDFKFQTWQ